MTQLHMYRVGSDFTVRILAYNNFVATHIIQTRLYSLWQNGEKAKTSLCTMNNVVTRWWRGCDNMIYIAHGGDKVVTTVLLKDNVILTSVLALTRSHSIIRIAWVTGGSLCQFKHFSAPCLKGATIKHGACDISLIHASYCKYVIW